MAEDIYDLIIIGGGPAGLSAGIYASRSRLNAILLEKSMPGGQVLFTDVIENFPGFREPIKGADLIDRIVAQAERCGLNIQNEEAIKISYDERDRHFIVECISKRILKTLSLILASGAVWKKLGVPGEEGLKGKGVSYCATCDGPLFKDRDVIVVGGGDKALEESLYLSKIANSVKVVHRRDRLRGVKELQERVFENGKIEVLYDSVITEIGGINSVEFVKITNKKTKRVEIIPCGAVFILIGIEPNSQSLRGIVDMNEEGFIKVARTMKTSKDGIYACGDVIEKDLYQIVSAVGEGAAAAFNAARFIEELKLI